MAILYAAAMTTLPAGPLLAQERFVLLIDGSGSMWGEVDGEHKIVILRRNLDRLLGELQTDAEVGLVAFGHREKGNCEDIEEVLSPRPYDAELLGAAIGNIQPKGKTPLSAAVQKAAESLRFTEEKATVVILGDGRESCGMDPCATAEELEATGVDFTVHAIAFDLADEVGTRQLQCFAHETGGLFLTATDSVELVAALEEVRQEVAPTPSPDWDPAPAPVAAASSVRLVARDAATGDPVSGALQWTLIESATEAVTIIEGGSGTESMDVAPGTYDIVVQSDDGYGEGRMTVAKAGETELVVEVISTAPAGLVLARDTVPAGEVLAAEWTFAGMRDDLVFIALADMPENRYPLDDDRRHVVGESSVARLVVPTTPGAYEVRYFRLSAGGLLHRARFDVIPSDVAIRGPEEALAGGTVEIEWTGPAAPGDFLFIAPADWDWDAYPTDADSRVAAAGLRALQLPVPGHPGRHEYRYYSWSNGTAMAAVPLEVTLRAAGISATAAVAAGAVVPVEFTGPRFEGDSMFFMPQGAADDRYYRGEEHLDFVDSESPAQMIAPAEPGTYELRYFSPNNGGVLARAVIQVTAPEVTLDAPRLIQRGERFKLRAQGPDAPGDVIFISEATSADNRYPLDESDQFRLGSAGGGFLDDDGFYVFDVVAPARPGQYEVRYMSWSNSTLLEHRALIVR